MTTKNDCENWTFIAEGETTNAYGDKSCIIGKVAAGAECWLENHCGTDVNLVVSVGDKKTPELPQINIKPTLLSSTVAGLNGDLKLCINGKEHTLLKGIDSSYFLERPEELKVGILIGKPIPKPVKPMTFTKWSDMTESEKNAEMIKTMERMNEKANASFQLPEISSEQRRKNALQSHMSDEQKRLYLMSDSEKFSLELKQLLPPKYFPDDSVGIIIISDQQSFFKEGNYLIDDLNTLQLAILYDEFHRSFFNSMRSFKMNHSNFIRDHPNLINELTSILNEIETVVSSFSKLPLDVQKSFFKSYFEAGKIYVTKSKHIPGSMDVIFKASSNFKEFMISLRYAFASKFNHISIDIAKTKEAMNAYANSDHAGEKKKQENRFNKKMLREAGKTTTTSKVAALTSKAIKGAMFASNRVSFFAAAAVEIYKYTVDTDPEKHWGELLGTIGIAFGKLFLAGVIGTLAAAAALGVLVALGVTSAATAPVIVVVALTIGFTIYAGKKLDELDEYLGITDAVKRFFRFIFKAIESSFESSYSKYPDYRPGPAS